LTRPFVPHPSLLTLNSFFRFSSRYRYNLLRAHKACVRFLQLRNVTFLPPPPSTSDVRASHGPVYPHLYALKASARRFYTYPRPPRRPFVNSLVSLRESRARKITSLGVERRGGDRHTSIAARSDLSLELKIGDTRRKKKV
jgi:hypothetical protein